MLILITALILCFLLMFFLIRGVNRSYIDSVLTKRQRKKLKSKSFSEWFLIKNQRKILPKFRVFCYFFQFPLFCITLLAIILCHSIGFEEAAREILWGYYVINGCWVIGAWLNFF